MASKTMVVLEDDIEGGKASETVRFSLDGTDFEIDLNEQNAEQLRGALEKYVDNARRVGGRRAPRKSVTRRAASQGDADPTAVRAWAAANGIKVSNRGRVSADVLRQYREAGN